LYRKFKNIYTSSKQTSLLRYYLTNKNIKFLDIEENGKQILRIIDKQFVSYEPINEEI
jgi:hypothetical protein